MLNNTYYESSTISTTENSYIEDTSKSLDKKFPELNLESITNEKEHLLEKLIKFIEEIIEENKLNLAPEENESEEIKDEEILEKEFFKKLLVLEEKPNISLSRYIYRINKYLDPEISTFIISFIYMEKLTSTRSLKLKIDENNIFKLILTSLTIAIKYNEDDTHDNKFFSKVGGLTLKQLNELELNFCAMLKWDLFISYDIFRKYYLHL